MNGTRGTQQERSVSIKVSKEIVPFQQTLVKIPNLVSDVKHDSIGHPESGKKVRLQLLVFLGIRLQPKTSDSLRP